MSLHPPYIEVCGLVSQSVQKSNTSSEYQKQNKRSVVHPKFRVLIIYSIIPCCVVFWLGPTYTEEGMAGNDFT